MRRALGLTWGALSRAPALALARACHRCCTPGRACAVARVVPPWKAAPACRCVEDSNNNKFEPLQRTRFDKEHGE